MRAGENVGKRRVCSHMQQLLLHDRHCWSEAVSKRSGLQVVLHPQNRRVVRSRKMVVCEPPHPRRLSDERDRCPAPAVSYGTLPVGGDVKFHQNSSSILHLTSTGSGSL